MNIFSLSFYAVKSVKISQNYLQRQVESTNWIYLEKLVWGKFTKMVVGDVVLFFLSAGSKHSHRTQKALGAISPYFWRDMKLYALLTKRVPSFSERELWSKMS